MLYEKRLCYVKTVMTSEKGYVMWNTLCDHGEMICYCYVIKGYVMWKCEYDMLLLCNV
jgi:hypothetical protein